MGGWTSLPAIERKQLVLQVPLRLATEGRNWYERWIVWA
jgi:hypothetical protein